MDWKRYAGAMLLFNLVLFVALFAMLLLQHLLPLNPQKMPAFSWQLALNTAVSFVTNTNWQAYVGEQAASYFTQMVGLAVHNFVSAATGMAIAIAVIRGFVRRKTSLLGNFWVDMTRCTLYILLPISLVAALAPGFPGGDPELQRLQDGAAGPGDQPMTNRSWTTRATPSRMPPATRSPRP